MNMMLLLSINIGTLVKEKQVEISMGRNVIFIQSIATLRDGAFLYIFRDIGVRSCLIAFEKMKAKSDNVISR